MVQEWSEARTQLSGLTSADAMGWDCTTSLWSIAEESIAEDNEWLCGWE